MSLNWKEIDLILNELDLKGMQIQKAVQSSYDVLYLKLYGKKGVKNILVSINPGACRLHESFDPFPRKTSTLRFAQFLNSKLVNGRIEEAQQLGEDRIIRLKIKNSFYAEEYLYVYIRLWTNAANVIVTNTEGLVLDAMKRMPKKKEITGGYYKPEEIPAPLQKENKREYFIRDFKDTDTIDISKESSFNKKIDLFYKRQKGSLSLEALREEAERKINQRINDVKDSLERLREKEKELSQQTSFKEYGEIILSNLIKIKEGDEWLEAENFYSEGKESIRIKLDPKKSPSMQAEVYFEKYRKSKSGINELRKQIAEEENIVQFLEAALSDLLLEEDPLILHRKLKSAAEKSKTLAKPALLPAKGKDALRPGLSFYVNDWLIMVGRDASENDTLLRKYVNGNDTWLHARDFPGSYVFIKYKAGKSIPLDILIDAGNLAIFYSKGRNKGEGDLFYTQAKNLRRVKNEGRNKINKGLVIPTQEKNLFIRVEKERLKRLEENKLEKN